MTPIERSGLRMTALGFCVMLGILTAVRYSSSPVSHSLWAVDIGAVFLLFVVAVVVDDGAI